MASEESDIDSVVTTPPSDTGQRKYEEFLEAESLYSNFENSIYSAEEFDSINNTPRRLQRHRDYRHHKGNGDLLDEKEQSPEPNVIEITQELQHISSKLKDENEWLNAKRKDLKKREQILSVAQKNFQTIIDLEVKRRLGSVEKGYREELEKTYLQLKEKTKNYKRLKENFDTLKIANDSLRLEVETHTKEQAKSEKQISSLQARLTNLQRLQEQSQRQPLAVTNLPPKSVSNSSSKHGAKNFKEAGEKQVKKAEKTSKALQNMCDLLPVLLNWVVETQLRSPLAEITSAGKAAQRLWQPDNANSEGMETSDLVQERCMKIIPALVDLLRHFPFHAGQISLSCLQFIHWAIKYLEENHSQSKNGLVTTLRRLGEELYHPRGAVVPILSKDTDEDDDDSSKQRLSKATVTISLPTHSSSSPEDKSKDSLYLKNPNPHIRLLSCFIILRTMTQVDLLANVLDELQNELQNDSAKQLFLYYKATPIILQYMKPVHKALVNNSIDVFLPLSMESPYLQPFLITCSNEAWFRTVALVLRTTSLDSKVFEKLSIILQKLSKMKSNKKLFEVYSITNLIQDLSRSMNTSGNHDHSFLDLNLRSILVNLSTPTAQCDYS